MSEALKPMQAFGMLVSAIKCGEPFTEAHEKAADVLRAALAPAEPGEGAHEWDDSGERCVKCGDKDWMAGPYCRAKPDTTAAVVGSMVESYACIATAPEHIYLCVSDDLADSRLPFPDEAIADITWSRDAAVNCTVIYERADLRHNAITSLRAETGNLQSRIADLERQLSEADTERAMLEKTIEELRSTDWAAEVVKLNSQLSEARAEVKQAGALKPSGFCQMMRNATSMQQLEHIQSCVNDLYGFDYSPDDGGQANWRKFFDVCEAEAARLQEEG